MLYVHRTSVVSLLYTIFNHHIFSIHTRDAAIRQSVPIEYLQNVDVSHF